MQLSIFRRLAGALVISLFWIQPAFSNEVCKLLEADLKAQTKELSAFHEEHSKIRAAYLQKDIFCKKTGATLTGSIAKAAESLSCEAQKDANHLNVQMTDLGLDCQTTFTRVLEAHRKVEAEYLPLFNDVASANEILRKSKILRNLCGRELKLSERVLADFVLLKGSMASAIVASHDASTNYQKFEQTARQLALSTAARNKSCGFEMPAIKPLQTAGAQLAAGRKIVPVPSGASPRSASTITGSIDESDANSSLFSGKIKLESAKKPAKSESGRAPASNSEFTYSDAAQATPERSAGEALFEANAAKAASMAEGKLGLAAGLAESTKAPEAMSEASNEEAGNAPVFRPEAVVAALAPGEPEVAAQATESAQVVSTSGAEVRYLGIDKKGDGWFQRDAITTLETRSLFAIVRHRYRVSVEREMSREAPSRLAGINR